MWPGGPRVARGAGGVLAAARRDPLHRQLRARPQDDPFVATPRGPGRDLEASLTTPSRRVRDSVLPRRGVQSRFGAVSQAIF